MNALSRHARFFVTLLLLSVSVAAITAPQPTSAGYLGVAFEYGADGTLVGVNFVSHPYTSSGVTCKSNNAMAVARTKLPHGHAFQTLCLDLIRPPAHSLTLIEVVNHGPAPLGFVAAAVELYRKPATDNPVFGADILGHSRSESGCIATARATIRSSVKHHKVRHPLTISCIAIPPPAKRPKPDGVAV